MHKITIYAPAHIPSPLRLDQAIAQSQEAIDKNLSRSLIRKLIVAGAVYLNGKRVRIASRPVPNRARIEVYWDAQKASPSYKAQNDIDRFLPLRVLYEDEAVICFDKPAGLPTQPTIDEARINLYALAKQQLQSQESVNKPFYLGLHHRLDRDTSGVVLFTKLSKYNAFIADQFKSHKCHKLYVAVVHGKLKNPKGHLESFLGPVGKKGKKAKFGSVHSGGKKAITDFLVLSENNEFSLVEVKIATGRTHQIRVHFSELGHPIVGDTLYGSPEKHAQNLNRHLLHAHALTITHPITHNSIRVESPIPQEFRRWVSKPE